MAENISLIDIIDEQLAAGTTQLPVFNKTAHRIQQESLKAEPDMRLIENLVIKDQTLTGEVLKVANSAFYKGLDKITTVRQAIVRLGYKKISDMIMMVTQKRNFESRDPFIKKIMDKLWRHSVGCALGSNWIATRCGFHDLSGEAFFAGLLHDIGKLFILSVLEDIKKSNKIDEHPSDALLNEVMVSLHTAHGYSLMKTWNLPEKYCEIARDHHQEVLDPKNNLLVLTRLANKACNKMGIGIHDESDILLTATEEADLLGLSEIDMAKLEIVLEDTTAFA